MKTLTQTLYKSLYCYRRGEFLPVYRNGQLANRNQFIAYKARRTAKWLLNK